MSCIYIHCEEQGRAHGNVSKVNNWFYFPLETQIKIKDKYCLTEHEELQSDKKAL